MELQPNGLEVKFERFTAVMQQKIDHRQGDDVQKDNEANSRAGEMLASKSDQIDYMADLLSELRDMALNNNLTTLAGILELAHTEARLRATDVA